MVLKRILKLATLTGSFNTGLIFDWLVLGKLFKDENYTALRKNEPRRAKIALGLCVSAGLRREEAVSVAFDDFQLLPMGNRFRTVINVKGKGAKDRAVPISDSLATDIETWHADTGDGFILRSVAKGGKVGSGLTAVSLFRIVAKYGRLQPGQPVDRMSRQCAWPSMVGVRPMPRIQAKFRRIGRLRFYQ